MFADEKIVKQAKKHLAPGWEQGLALHKRLRPQKALRFKVLCLAVIIKQKDTLKGPPRLSLLQAFHLCKRGLSPSLRCPAS